MGSGMQLAAWSWMKGIDLPVPASRERPLNGHWIDSYEGVRERYSFEWLNNVFFFFSFLFLCHIFYYIDPIHFTALVNEMQVYLLWICLWSLTTCYKGKAFWSFHSVWFKGNQYVAQERGRGSRNVYFTILWQFRQTQCWGWRRCVTRQCILSVSALYKSQKCHVTPRGSPAASESQARLGNRTIRPQRPQESFLTSVWNNTILFKKRLLDIISPRLVYSVQHCPYRGVAHNTARSEKEGSPRSKLARNEGAEKQAGHFFCVWGSLDHWKRRPQASAE